jgi:hypothetical protein
LKEVYAYTLRFAHFKEEEAKETRKQPHHFIPIANTLSSL